MRRLLIALVTLYRYMISPFIGRHCRFHPSCSEYAIDAINQQGVIKGCYLALRRLLRCHPFNPGGYDPVPENHSDNHKRTAH